MPSAELIELGTDCCACKPLICDGVTCAAPQCGLGETVSLPAESCCPACVPETTSCSNDTDFICSAFTCAEGYVPVETEDECCGHCTGDETFCEDEAAAYLTQLQAWLTPDVTACTEDTDCVHLPASNQCKASCFGSAINSAFAEELSATINDYAEANCSRCPWISVTCPAIEMIPTCNQGTCQ